MAINFQRLLQTVSHPAESAINAWENARSAYHGTVNKIGDSLARQAQRGYAINLERPNIPTFSSREEAQKHWGSLNEPQNILDRWREGYDMRHVNQNPSSTPTLTPDYSPSSTSFPSPTPTATPSLSLPTPQPTASIEPRYSNFMTKYVKEGKPETDIQMPKDLTNAIDKASYQYGIPREVLAAIAHQENGNFDNGNEHGGGLGRGYFQIDLGQHPEITEAQAKDPEFATNWTAQNLMNHVDLYTKHNHEDPVFDPIRSHNGSLTNPKTLNYINSIINKIKKFNFK